LFAPPVVVTPVRRPCTPNIAGAAGPDRVTKLSYDAADRQTKVQAAYGTADQSDEVTTTYTANGQVASVTDGEGNKTSYEYDGFDRLCRPGTYRCLRSRPGPWAA
jgi:YD repeat-containing protein